jgi:hypothetical protein
LVERRSNYEKQEIRLAQKALALPVPPVNALSTTFEKSRPWKQTALRY